MCEKPFGTGAQRHSDKGGLIHATIQLDRAAVLRACRANRSPYIFGLFLGGGASSLDYKASLAPQSAYDDCHKKARIFI